MAYIKKIKISSQIALFKQFNISRREIKEKNKKMAFSGHLINN